MRRDLATLKPVQTFISCQKETEIILKKLFVQSQPYSDYLKRLLMINTKDCLDPKINAYQEYIKNEGSLKQLIDNQYIRLQPKIKQYEHEEVKTYIILSFANFIPNANNNFFKDCNVIFDIICHTDNWDIGQFQQRPLKIAGYIDGLLDKQRLSGVGEFNFLAGDELILDEHLAGYTLMYRAVHFSEDQEKKDA